MTSTPLTVWDEPTADAMARDFFSNGWMRALPAAGTTLLVGTVVRMRSVHRDEFDGPLFAEPGEDVWAQPCWQDPETFDDESLAELNAEYPEDADEDETAAQANARIQAQHDAKVAILDGYAAHIGLGPVRTNEDVLRLLVAAGALHLDGELISPMHPMPGTDDVFPISDEERAALADLRAMDM
ncbi:DUF6042 family protein [Streptomyces sp. NPDC001552]|uniref:DUF6042 family protein n=1 Tax=Streptomyces sp. NPDC001552 TaxID=3364587 RepID=UPI0036B4F80B